MQMMRQSWLCMVLAVAAALHTKQHCISRRGLAGAVAAAIVPKPCAASVDDLPPDALKALARYQGTLQIAADTFVFGIGEQAKDPKQWDALPRAIAPGAQAAERTLWAPLNGLALTFLDDELVDRIRTFELVVKDLASTAVNSRGADPSQVNAKAIARVTKLHAECVAGLDKVFKRVNALAAPDRPLVASATARSGALYTDYVKNVAQCQQAGGPMVSVQTGGLVCGPALEAQYLAGQR